MILHPIFSCSGGTSNAVQKEARIHTHTQTIAEPLIWGILRFSSSYILDRRYFFSITCSLHSLSLLVVKFCTQEESDEGGILHGAIYEVIRDFEQVKWGWLQGKKSSTMVQGMLV